MLESPFLKNVDSVRHETHLSKSRKTRQRGLCVKREKNAPEICPSAAHLTKVHESKTFYSLMPLSASRLVTNITLCGAKKMGGKEWM